VANILTPQEAANALRCDAADPEMVDLLPQVDSFIILATGHDWTTDSPIEPVAKSAARMLLVMWHENPAMLASGLISMGFGLTAALTQLEAKARLFREFAGGYGAGPVELKGARMGDTVRALIGLIGLSGDQSASFESVITIDDQIQQLAPANLSAKWFRVTFKPVGDL
jgi:hypothetical protein